MFNPKKLRLSLGDTGAATQLTMLGGLVTAAVASILVIATAPTGHAGPPREATAGSSVAPAVPLGPSGSVGPSGGSWTPAAAKGPAPAAAPGAPSPGPAPAPTPVLKRGHGRHGHRGAH